MHDARHLCATSPGRLVNQANRRLRAGLARALEAAGHAITVETWTVLAALGEADGLTQIELGDRVDKNRHHMSRLLGELEAQKLVARVAGVVDKRLKRVLLTDEGRRVHRRLVPVVEGYLEATFAGIPPADYAGFIRCLQHIVGAADPGPEEAP